MYIYIYTYTYIYTHIYCMREIFGGRKYWRIWQIRGNPPNFYPPNVLVLPSKYLAKVSSPIFYHPKVKKMCQYFPPPKSIFPTYGIVSVENFEV